MTDPVAEFKMPPMIEALPTWVFNDWVEYRGETYFAMVDVQKSLRCGRPVIDLAYCATRGMNNVVLKTVNYNADLFKKSHLAS